MVFSYLIVILCLGIQVRMALVNLMILTTRLALGVVVLDRFMVAVRVVLVVVVMLSHREC